MRAFRILAIGLVVASSSSLSALDFHLDPLGDDAAPGTAEAPMRTLGAAARAVLASQPGPGKEPIVVWIHGGRYEVDETVVFGEEFCGTEEFPIRFQAVGGQVPVFDSGLGLDMSKAELVRNPAWLARLAPSVRGKVHALKITDAGTRKALCSGSVRCSLDGRMMTVARYPNAGFGHIDRIVDKGAVYAHGRTPGAPPKWTMADPVGGCFTVLGKDTAAWEREYGRVRKAGVTGYLSYDWYRENHPVADIRDGQIRLGDSSRYGVIKVEKIPRRLMVSNLLCELDAPGEFYFDEDGGSLFFLPPVALAEGSRLSIWGGPPLAHVRGAAHLSLGGLVVEGCGQGKAVVWIESGDHVSLNGCTLRNSSRPAVVIAGGHDNGLQSCDIYDVPHHVTLGGGDVRELRSARNFVRNCHFTQVAAADYYGRIRVSGVGNIFRNNLVHNFPGQVMTFGDCDHRIEFNEFFNIGYEEGDGGAIYSGAAMWSWGNELRHNLLHHLMCLPQAHPRGGIYPDDGDQGDVIEGNVFYKAAHRAVLINGGAGQRVRGNLFLDGYIGIYNTEGYAEKQYREIAQYDSGKLKRGDKGDKIWRTEQAIGPEGWNREPWASRFPLFRKIMNQERMRFYPIECDFSGNRFAGNWRDIEYRNGSGPKDIDGVGFIRSDDNRGIAMDVFRDPVRLDFRYKSTADGGSLPEIPFAEIGLKRDTWRKRPPERGVYRAAVRERFAGRSSYDPKAVYDPKTINETVYYNTGRLLLKSGGMLHAVLSADTPASDTGR